MAVVSWTSRSSPVASLPFRTERICAPLELCTGRSSQGYIPVGSSGASGSAESARGGSRAGKSMPGIMVQSSRRVTDIGCIPLRRWLQSGLRKILYVQLPGTIFPRSARRLAEQLSTKSDGLLCGFRRRSISLSFHDEIGELVAAIEQDLMRRAGRDAHDVSG